MNLLDLDARWKRFNDENRTCPCCDRRFNGVFDIGFDHPDTWPHASLRDAGSEEVVVGDDKLGTDLCRHGEYRYIRCVLPLPIRGSDEVFNFGVWGSVHPDSFYAYIDYATGENDGFDGCFAWLMNTLPGFEDEDTVPCNLIPGEDGMRPSLFAQEGALAEAQKNGISFDDLLDIYAASGNDIRPHLSAD